MSTVDRSLSFAPSPRMPRGPGGTLRRTTTTPMEEKMPVKTRKGGIMDRETLEQIISQCQTELATNFDCPAPQIIAMYAARAGWAYGLTEKQFKIKLGVL